MVLCGIYTDSSRTDNQEKTHLLRQPYRPTKCYLLSYRIGTTYYYICQLFKEAIDQSLINTNSHFDYIKIIQ